MNKEIAAREALAVADAASLVMLGTNGDDGFPAVKAMLKMANEGLKKIWFSTNTSSRRVKAIRKNGKACVYFMDARNWKGLLLTGMAQVLDDQESKKRLWREGFEKYYPLGVSDPDYCVVLFTAVRGNYYHALENADFIVD